MGGQGKTRDGRGWPEKLSNRRGRWGTVGDGGGWWRVAAEHGGWWVTARVMSHDSIMVCSEVYDFNLGQYRRPKL